MKAEASVSLIYKASALFLLDLFQKNDGIKGLFAFNLIVPIFFTNDS